MEQSIHKKLNAASKNSTTKPFNSSQLLFGHEDSVKQIHMTLKSANSVLIATHEHPDGDALGSSLALLHALRLQGKKVVAFIPDPAPEMFSFLPGIGEFTTEKPNVDEFDVVVMLDSTYMTRTHLAEEAQNHPKTICIDHHQDNKGEGTMNLIVPQTAATAYILTAFFEETKTAITKDMATCLLTGIFTDTGSFMHDSTTPDILKMAGSLMKKGARLSHIAHETYQKKDLPVLKIWGRALSRIMTSENTGMALSVITMEDLDECKASLDDLSGVVNMLNTLPDTKFALLLCEYESGKIKGSLRSEPHKGIDVSAIAKQLGGGGHKLAAGFEVKGHLKEKQGKWRIV